MKMHVLTKRFLSVSTAATLALLGFPLHAATVTWDNSSGTNAWSTPANWDTNVEPTAADDVVLAAGLGATLTLSAGELAKSLQFDASYTLSGGGLTLSSASTIGVLAGQTGVIGTALTVTGGTKKTGDGTLTLSGSNTFSGGIVVSAGTLRVSNANAIGAAANVATVNSGATLEVTTGITFDRSITLNNGGTVAGSGAATNNGKITLNAAATAVTFATSAAGDVFTVGNGASDVTGGTSATTINVSGPGTVRLGAGSDFDGSWNVGAGSRLELGATAALGDTAASGVTLAGGSLVGRLASGTIFTGPTNLTLTASSSLISDRSSAGAGVTHTFGSVAMGAQTLTVAPGANATSGTAGIVVGNVTLSGDATFAVNDAGATNGKLTTGSLLGGGTARTITKTGAGDFAITGGATDLGAGSQLNMSGGGNLDLLFPALGAGASIAVTAAQHPLGAAGLAMTDGTLNLLADGDNTTAAQTFVLANGFTLSGNVTLDAARRSGSNTTKTFEIPSLALGSGASVGVGGANTYGVRVTGALTLHGNATLQGTSLSTRSGLLTLNSGISGGAGDAVSIAGGTSVLNLAINAASTYGGGTNVSGSNVTLNAANALGTGPLAQSGGSVTVNTDGAIAGAITLSGTGSLRVNGNNALAANAIALNGGTLDLRSNTSTAFSTGAFTLGGDATINVANNGSGTSQAITFATTLNVSGNRTFTFTSANSFTPILASVALAGDLTLSTSSPIVHVQSVSQDATPRRVLKAGPGTIELEAAGAFSGGAEVLAGMLQIDHAGALGSSVLTVGDTSGAATATARLSAGLSLANDIVIRAGSSGAATLSTIDPGVTWGGNIALQRTVTLEHTDTGGPTTFGGVMSGVGKVTKIGGGEIILENAANSFGDGSAASVNITVGTLTVTTDGALGAAANGVTIAGGTTFRANGTFTSERTITPGGAAANIDVTTVNTLTLNAALGGNVAFDKEGSGTLAFGPAVTSTRTAATNVNTGTLRLSGATSLGLASPITIAGATLDLRNDANTNYAHPLTIGSGTNIVNVDRAVGGVATGGTHTLGAIALAAQTLNTTGSNGFGLAVGATTTTGASTLHHDAPGALTVASIGLGGTSGTFTFTLDGDGGDVFISGALAETGAPTYHFAKRGSHTLHLGTGFATRGTVTIADGTFDLNNNNVALQNTLTIGGGTLNTAVSIATGTGALTLGGTLTYSATLGGPGTTFVGNLDLGAATRTFAIGDSGAADVDLDINGPISGPAGIGLTKTLSGTLRLSGAGNTHSGPTGISLGVLELNKSSGDAIGIGGLDIASTNSTTVRLLAPNQINDAAPVSVSANSGGGGARLDLAGFSETVGAVSITANTSSGARISTGAAGSLVLAGNLALANNSSSSTAGERRVLLTGTGGLTTATNDGTLDLGGAARNIAVTTTVVSANAANANAIIETAIVHGGINKTGPQALFLTNAASTFAGGLNIADGIVDVSVSGAAGVGPITFNNTAASALRLSAGGVTLSNPIVVSAAGAAEAKIIYSGGIYSNATLSGPVTLERNLTIDVVTGFIDQGAGELFGRLTVSGGIDDGAGTFSMTKKGDGVLRLAGTNTHGGGTFIEKGTLAFGADTALGQAGVPLTIGGGALHAEASLTSSRAVIFTSAGSIRVDAGNVLALTGTVTPANKDMGFYGGGTTILSGTGGGGAGGLIVGKYAGNFASPGAGTPQIDFGHVLSVRGAVALPTGNIWILNDGVLELGTGDFTRAVGTGAGKVRMETSIGAGFAACGANRIVNLGGAGATLIFGDPVTKFLRGDTGPGIAGVGALILGSTTATHTLEFQNPIEFNNGDTTSSRTITVPDGPAAKEAILSGGLSLNGLPGTPGISLELDVSGALDITGRISGAIALSMNGTGTLTLAGVQDYPRLTTSAGTTNVNSMLGTGFSILNANAKTNIGADQALGELNIGDGAVVTLGAAAPAAAPFQTVPEPCALSLLAIGLAALIGRPGRGVRSSKLGNDEREITPSSAPPDPSWP